MKKLKSYIAGIVTGALLFTVPVIADSVKELVEVYFNTITVTVDGVKVEADNILYEGRTYVPLRAISEICGKTVDWDDATKTANIHDSYGVVYTGDALGTANGVNITKEMLDTYMIIAKMENSEEGKELSEEEIMTLAKENIVYDIALYDYAKTVGVTPDKEFEDYYAQYINYMKSQYPQYEQLLQMIGFTEKAMKQQMQTEYVVQKLIETVPASFMATEGEMKSYYEANKEDWKYDGLKAKHILISTVDENGNPLSEEKVKELKKIVDEIYDEIKKGADFDSLMNEFGEDPGVKANPDGYVFTKGDMVPEFENAAYALEVGQVSEPVLSAYGYHIIKLVDKIEYIPYEEAKEEILNKLSTEKVKETVKMLEKNITANWN